MTTEIFASPRRTACIPRYLPRTRWLAAAQNAVTIREDNAAEGAQLEAPSPEGGRLALDVTKYWGKGGVRLTVGFLDNPRKELRKRIISHMNAWNKTANVRFTETAHDAQVRIARVRDDGYWSYLGTDILLIPRDEPTMNLDSFTMKTADSEFFRVVRHETGHTLGFPHEHMRKELVALLDEDKVIDEFMAEQGWSEEDVREQVLTPLETSSILGTKPDVRSIMCYQIEAHLTKNNKAIPGGDDIDASDFAFAALIYPKK